MSLQNEAFATPKFTPESPSHWKPDDSRVNCSNPDCRVSFSIFTRKHHCRSCAEIYCDSCSNYRLKARSKREPNLIVRVRVCKKCFDTFRTRKETGRTIRRANRAVNPSLNQPIQKQLAEPVKDGKLSTTQSISESVKTTNLDGPSLAPVEVSVSSSINQSINGPIPVGKLSVVSSHDEEDDFYSDDEGDHPVETDDEYDPSINPSANRRSANRSTITLDGDTLPSVHFSTDKTEFYTIEEESAERSTNPSIDQSIEPKIVSEERDDKFTNQSINLDGGKIDNLVYTQLPMTLTGRLDNQIVNRSMHSVDQSAVIDLLNSKSDRSFDKESIHQSTTRSVEKRDISLDGPSVVPIVTTNQSINVTSNQPMKPVISMNLDSSNMDQKKIVIDPTSINQPINQSAKPSPKKGKKSPKKSPKKAIRPISQSTSQSASKSINTSTDQLTELDRPFSSTNRSIVSGVGSFNQSISGPDVTSTNQSIEPPTSESINHNQDAAEDRLMRQWIDQSVESSIDQSIDQSEDSVMSTKSSSPIGLAALPKQKSLNPSSNQSTSQTTKSLLDRTKQSTNQSINQTDDCAPLSGEIDAAQNWAQSVHQSTNRSTNLPVPPACWPNAQLVDQVEHQAMNYSTNQSSRQSTDKSINPSNDQSSDDDLNDMWSPIGRTSASPMGLAAMNINPSTSQSNNPSINRSSSSSSGEFSSGGKRKVKVRVRRDAVTSWKSKLMHPVPTTMIVLLAVLITATLLPGAVLSLVSLAGIAGAIAYFWPSVLNVVSSTLPIQQTTAQSINQSINRSTDHSVNQSINENAKERSNQSINQSSNLLKDRSSHLTGMSKDQSINQSIDQSIDRIETRNASVDVQREHRVKRVV